MKVRVIRDFFSRKLGRVVKRGEVIEETYDWCLAICDQRLGEIVDWGTDSQTKPDDKPKPRRGKSARKKTIRIRGSNIETTSLEHDG